MTVLTQCVKSVGSLHFTHQPVNAPPECDGCEASSSQARSHRKPLSAVGSHTLEVTGGGLRFLQVTWVLLPVCFLFKTTSYNDSYIFGGDLNNVQV